MERGAPAGHNTNGSSGTASVHSAGSETNSPASSRTYTRSARQLCRRLTNSNSRPAHGWNGCVTRTHDTALRSAISRAVDGPIERRAEALNNKVKLIVRRAYGFHS